MMVETALLKVPKEQRVCMVLHFVEGFNIRRLLKL